MPAGTPPSKELEIYLVNSRGTNLGAFGPDFEEITRLGLSEQRFSQTTARGDLVQVTGIHFTEDLSATREFIQFAEGLQSYEVNLKSSSTDKEWMVFLRRVASNYQPIVDTGRGNYLIQFSFELQRTN